MSQEIIIIPGCTDLNRGDQALVWESARLIQEVIPNAQFSVLESGVKKEDILLQSRQTKKRGFSIIPKILRHPSRITQNKSSKAIAYSKADYFLWGLQGMVDLFSTSLLLSKSTLFNKLGTSFLSGEQKDTINRFKNATAIVIKGGGFIHTYGKITDFYTMYFSLYHVLLGIRHNKKILVFPNSIGPIIGLLNKKLIKYIFSKCELLTVREDVSKKYLEENLHIKSHLYPDLGFYLHPKDSDYSGYLKKHHIPLGTKKLVGVTLRPYRFPKSVDPEQRYKSYIEEIAHFVISSISKNFHIVFFAHTLGPSSHEDDRIAISDVLDLVPENSKKDISYIEDFDLDCQDLMGLYAHLDVMIGTRFHSVIFALNVQVPSIAIAYGGNKSFGIMQEIELSEYVFPIESVTASGLEKALDNVLDNKSSYLEKIKKHRLILEDKRKQNVSLIRDVLQ